MKLWQTGDRSIFQEGIHFVHHLIRQLLPNSTPLSLEEAVEANTGRMTLNLTSTQPQAACPVCQQLSQRVHSSYERRLRDLNWAECSVTLEITVRKLFCDNQSCQRRIFSERLPQLTAPWARRTNRMTQQIQDIGVALGGTAGARLLQKQNYSFSRDTLLRCLARLPLPPIGTLKQLGVDDFAFAKRQRYGTILVDLERRRPLALLKDREANTLAQWLEQHPGIEVLSRDRSVTYKSGMSQGAPAAIQVADRFHLLQNLTEVLEQTLSPQGAMLKAVDTAQRLADAPDGAVVVVSNQAPAQPDAQQRAEGRRQGRLKTYQKVWQLHQQGWSSRAIAQTVKLSSRTVQRYLLTPNFPERQGRSDRGRSLLNPYKAFLLQQYNQGCRQVKRLFGEIQAQGYTGSYQTVARYVHQLAQAQGVTLRPYPTHRVLPPVAASSRPVLTARRASFLILRRTGTLRSQEQQLVQRLVQQTELASAIALAQDFAQLVRQRLSDQFDLWLERAEQSQMPPFERFVRSLKEDYDAVKAGVTLPTSNGQVEGQSNRLKVLKRQMYGRAGIDLLERRFLLAS